MELVTADGDVLTQPNTCCRYLASLTQLNAQLQGETPEQQATISEWLSRRHTTLAHLTEEHLAEVWSPCGPSSRDPPVFHMAPPNMCWVLDFITFCHWAEWGLYEGDSYSYFFGCF